MTSADRRWWHRYDRYLNSQGWELTREACFRRDGYRCRRCGLKGSPRNPLQADHLTYENYNRIGRTPVGDLQTLCHHCHQIASRRRFSNSRLSMRRLIRFVVAAVAIWMLLTVLRSLPAENQSAIGNTLVIPSLVKIHRHHRHHGEPVQPFPKLD